MKGADLWISRRPAFIAAAGDACHGASRSSV